MKKIIPVLLLFLALIGCKEEQKQNQTKQKINSGFVHFAAILVLDDLITNGIKSDFISLSPVPIVNPDETITAEAVLEDFKRDFIESQDKYPLRLSEGLSVTWKIDHNADAQYGLSYYKEDRTTKTIFAGKLSLRFDPEYYSSTSYPTYSKDSTTTIICREFTGATERKNNYLVWIDVAFDRCMAVTDYYASVRNQLKNQLPPMKERLTNVYAGNEAVNEIVANKLITYYLAGNTFTSDSICLTGQREECLSSLKNEIIKKHEDSQITDNENIKIRITDNMNEKKEKSGSVEGKPSIETTATEKNSSTTITLPPGSPENPSDKTAAQNTHSHQITEQKEPQP